MRDVRYTSGKVLETYIPLQLRVAEEFICLDIGHDRIEGVSRNQIVRYHWPTLGPRCGSREKA